MNKALKDFIAICYNRIEKEHYEPKFTKFCSYSKQDYDFNELLIDTRIDNFELRYDLSKYEYETKCSKVEFQLVITFINTI